MSANITTKTVQITGNAAEGLGGLGGGGSHKRHSRRKHVGLTTITQEGGTHIPAASPAAIPAAPTVTTVTTVTTPVEGSPQLPQLPQLPLKSQTGGGKPKPKPKIVLDPTQKGLGGTPIAATKLKIVMKTTPSVQSTGGTRKHRRQVRVNLTKLGRQMTRHKKIQQDSVTTPIESIKKILQDAHLAKPDTTAPEELLRKMYADYQTLKQGAV